MRDFDIVNRKIAIFGVDEQRCLGIKRTQQRGFADAENASNQRMDAARFGKAFLGVTIWMDMRGAFDCLGGGAGPKADARPARGRA